jgi:hypothetical protein
MDPQRIKVKSQIAQEGYVKESSLDVSSKNDP